MPTNTDDHQVLLWKIFKQLDDIEINDSVKDKEIFQANLQKFSPPTNGIYDHGRSRSARSLQSVCRLVFEDISIWFWAPGSDQSWL